VAKTNAHYVDVLLEQAGNMALDTDSILQEAGLQRDAVADQWIENDYLASLVKIIWRETGDETMGLDPEPMRMGTWALACDYMLGAETLGDLYRRGQRICSYLPPTALGIELAVDEDTATVEILCHEGERDPHHFLVEFLSVVWHRFPCWAIDEHIPVRQASFRYGQPPHGWFYEELLQSPVAFDQQFNGFSFSKKFLSRPVRRSRVELETWLHNSPADLLYMPGRDTSINAHIRRQLAGELEEKMRFPAFDNICESLHMSGQVVRRRLAEEGTSYQKIKDAVRLDRITDLLATPELPIADIAELAGFTEPAALSRAFKKWTGMTPAQYRESKGS
jgi:AraC-like DNA-binding protein